MLLKQLGHFRDGLERGVLAHVWEASVVVEGPLVAVDVPADGVGDLFSQLVGVRRRLDPLPLQATRVVRRQVGDIDDGGGLRGVPARPHAREDLLTCGLHRVEGNGVDLVSEHGVGSVEDRLATGGFPRREDGPTVVVDVLLHRRVGMEAHAHFLDELSDGGAGSGFGGGHGRAYTWFRARIKEPAHDSDKSLMRRAAPALSMKASSPSSRARWCEARCFAASFSE